jgi:hypothetical protein
MRTIDLEPLIILQPSLVSWKREQTTDDGEAPWTWGERMIVRVLSAFLYISMNIPCTEGDTSENE